MNDFHAKALLSHLEYSVKANQYAKIQINKDLYRMSAPSHTSLSTVGTHI